MEVVEASVKPQLLATLVHRALWEDAHASTYKLADLSPAKKTAVAKVLAVLAVLQSDKLTLQSRVNISI